MYSIASTDANASASANGNANANVHPGQPSALSQTPPLLNSPTPLFLFWDTSSGSVVSASSLGARRCHSTISRQTRHPSSTVRSPYSPHPHSHPTSYIRHT
ncbi:hypothetical protein V493_07695 [Pseudogymnoascus sp. VKM F-4281 (FW-2241)]|nr:hypothetical protein V493_07695 [Pseudogymnoascus sp. VKM F-4281 (FW-2241)]